MTKEHKFTDLKVGDRVQLSSNLPPHLVVDISQMKYGAVGISGDLPEHENATERAQEKYIAAYRKDKLRPKSTPRSDIWNRKLD